MHLRLCNSVHERTNANAWSCATNIFFIKINWMATSDRYRAHFIQRPDGLVILRTTLNRGDKIRRIKGWSVECANHHPVTLFPNESIQILDADNSVRQL